MLPAYTRVVAIDDVEDHLQKIVWGLCKAGFCPVPFLFEDGMLENPPQQPLVGIRLVFSDIHMVSGGAANEVLHANNIISCLKKIVNEGPYALIFWSQFPAEATRMAQLINERAVESGMTLPLAFGQVDKNRVFSVGHAADEFDAVELRRLIIEQIKDFHTLGVVSSWDERVSKAAAHTTNQLFKLADTDANRVKNWNNLLAYLSCEALGANQARQNIKNALDSALLPLLEDKLTQIGHQTESDEINYTEINAFIPATKGAKRPKTINCERLNSSYLIEELRSNNQYEMHDRGIVTELSGEYINSGAFITAFGLEDRALKEKEFIWAKMVDEQLRRLKLHVVEAGPECDHVQGKVSTHRYLLALMVPQSLFADNCINDKNQYRNASILDSGPLHLNGDIFHLLISCRCFMALAPSKKVGGRPVLRLRKDFINELTHHYTNHARRPGVMRFHN